MKSRPVHMPPMLRKVDDSGQLTKTWFASMAALTMRTMSRIANQPDPRLAPVRRPAAFSKDSANRSSRKCGHHYGRFGKRLLKARGPGCQMSGCSGGGDVAAEWAGHAGPSPGQIAFRVVVEWPHSSRVTTGWSRTRPTPAQMIQ